MKLWLIVGIVVIAALLLGFLIGIILPENGPNCTFIACSCNGVSGERPCNGCFSDDIIFAIGVFNAIHHCTMSEIITCENNTQISSRIDVENKTCTTDWYILGFNLRYLSANPEQTDSKDIG